MHSCFTFARAPIVKSTSAMPPRKLNHNPKPDSVEQTFFAHALWPKPSLTLEPFADQQPARESPMKSLNHVARDVLTVVSGHLVRTLRALEARDCLPLQFDSNS